MTEKDKVETFTAINRVEPGPSAHYCAIYRNSIHLFDARLKEKTQMTERHA